MKYFLNIILLFWITLGVAQEKLELAPKGFKSIVMEMPDQSISKLLQISKTWAPFYNKNSYDVFDVTDHSLIIESFIDNACYYWNLGEKYNYNIKYTLKVVFGDDKKYTMTFTVKEIYAEEKLLNKTVADFFTTEGNLKEDYIDVKPSLEKTANQIVRSYTDFIAR